MEKAKKSPLPDLGDIIFLLILNMLVFGRPAFLFGDGSTGWHLATGEYILQTGSIPHHDIFSYTFPNAPWVAYEWLCDVLMAGAVDLGGMNLLAVLFAIMIALLFLLLYENCRRQKCHFLIVTLLVVAGAFASSIHWLARPHVFTWLALYVFSSRLESFYRGTISGARLITVLFLTMIFWVNLHPGFLFGMAILAIYLVISLLKTLIKFDDLKGWELESCPPSGEQTKVFGLAFLATGIATLFNPYGLGMWEYIGKYLQGSRVLQVTNEFAPPAFGTGFQPLCLEVLLLMLVIGIVISRRRPSVPQLVSTLAFGHLALTGVRNIPLFVIVGLPFIADRFSSVRSFATDNAEDGPAKVNPAVRLWTRIGNTFDKVETQCRMHLIPALAAAGLLVLSLAGSTVITSGFSPEKMPTGTLECIATKKLDPRKGFNLDNWGGYINYKTGNLVFIDDRLDFYGEPFYFEYGKVVTAAPGWQKILDNYGIEWVIFPKNGKLSARLKEEPGWEVICEDKAAYLFKRSPVE